ncbi:MAG: hypothetical protein QM808_07300 [Steroidobacteraceae bacterium]
MSRRRPLLTLACTLSLVGGMGSVSAASPKAVSIRTDTSPMVKLLLLDASTAQPIRDTGLTIQADEGIRCIRAPCPSGYRRWQGRIDSAGRIDIPHALLLATVTLDTGTLAGDLIEDSRRSSGGIWTVELLPKVSLPDGTSTRRPLKLLDARSEEAIHDRAVRVEFRLRKSTHEPLSMTSNALGYIFLPPDIPAGAQNRAYVAVAGYQPAKIDDSRSSRRIYLTRS